jgi:hypothetical protein
MKSGVISLRSRSPDPKMPARPESFSVYRLSSTTATTYGCNMYWYRNRMIAYRSILCGAGEMYLDLPSFDIDFHHLPTAEVAFEITRQRGRS